MVHQNEGKDSGDGCQNTRKEMGLGLALGHAGDSSYDLAQVTDDGHGQCDEKGAEQNGNKVRLLFRFG